MTLAIWEYPFHVNDTVSFSMPEGARVLHVGAQGRMPCLWALVDPEAPKEVRAFKVYGTGGKIADSDIRSPRGLLGTPEEQRERMRRAYVGTLLQHDGALAWHVFEVAR